MGHPPMYGVALSDPSLLLAINDLIASIAMSHHAPINCGRVIETIREVMTPTGPDREIGWQTMRENLNIESEYLKFVTKVSTAPRHGRRVVATSQADFDETTKRSWTVMNRFLEYKKRGEKKLSLTEFPQLSKAEEKSDTFSSF